MPENANQQNFERLYRVSQALNNARNETELLALLAQTISNHQVRSIDLFYFDLDYTGMPAGMHKVATWHQPGSTTTPVGTQYDFATFPLRPLFMREDKVAIVPNVEQDDTLDEVIRVIFTRFHIRASVSITLHKTDRWVGFISMAWDTPQLFDEAEQLFYKALPVMLSPIVENQRLAGNLEQILDERTTALREAQEMLHTVLNTIPGRVFWKDRDLRLIGCNRAYAQDVGLPMAEILGQQFFDFEEPSTVARYQELERHLMETEKPLVNQDEYMVERDGRTRWLRINKTPLRNSRGEVIGILGVYNDISDMKNAQEKQAQLQQSLIDTQQQLIQELSVPIIPLMNRIIIVPLIGQIDAGRARVIMRAILAGISQLRAKILILDITGVPLVDNDVATYLDRAIQAARLKGARTILSGISDGVAQAIIELEIDWSNLDIVQDLQTGLTVAME